MQGNGQLDRHTPPSTTTPSIPLPHCTQLAVGGLTTHKRSAQRKIVRPATAPSADDVLLLPSMPSWQIDGSVSPCPSPVPECQVIPPQEAQFSANFKHSEDEVDYFFSNVSVDDLPSDIPPSFSDINAMTTSGYDWAAFMAAYAAGRWDPHRNPNPPLACHVSDVQSQIVDEDVIPSNSEPQKFTSSSNSSSTTLEQRLPPTSVPSLGIGVARNSTGSIKSRTAMALYLPLPNYRARNLLSTSLPNHPVADQPPPSVSVPNTEVHATVATMRWAAARVDISPLALPSPEHELTDPMRGVTAAIPGAHSRDSSTSSDYLVTPGGTRRTRLPSFWKGTTDVENKTLATIEGSPASPRLQPIDLDQPLITPKLGESSAVVVDNEGVIISPFRTSSISALHPSSSNLSTALAPTNSTVLPMHIHPHTDFVVPPTDYFGDTRPPPLDLSGSQLQSQGNDNGRGAASAPTALLTAFGLPATAGECPLSNDDDTHPSSATSQIRRISLTRQASSPLPFSNLSESCPANNRHVGGRGTGDNVSHKMGRAARFEHCFTNLGYLLPPIPPDEIDRRRALYKFNIWHTGADQNFDRIVHLVKLVFNTKCVMISLIDEHEQWFKSEWGCKTTSVPRGYSFCGHTILQRGDEPMVILDSLHDWRFAHNPITLGSPPVRFYAGAPLRTQEGYNIGTLAVMDDQLREEFSPRQRHTLKEFAAITMREMELWRDKIQLRIRERIQLSMEQFSRECLEIESDVSEHNSRPDINLGSSMDKVYDRAAKLVKRTLDVEGVLVMDVSHCVIESLTGDGSVSITLHHGELGMDPTRTQLTTEEGGNLMLFFDKYPDGRISEGIIPQSFRPFLPTRIQYALTVPIFNVDKRPFALLCAYNATCHSKRFLEGHELSYLRAIGVIILSAVLKRRMVLADKAKGLFISNISHELRTPLHGILAAAELLSESPLNPSQASFLQTVQACGTSLVETVNHVLDFTKLSGSGKAGGVEHVIVPTTVDLMQLIEDAVDGCWIGYRARSAITGENDIGSVYSPPKDVRSSPVATARKRHVETVVDIGYRPEGWTLRCERGGIRRVLMNLFGNSLKFTTDGYIHVILRQLRPAEDDPPNKVKVELSVLDTGKGISQGFLKNQLFHPFSQENPLQTGTGLGLAIVSSIVSSENVGGKVDVASKEGLGTEIKVTFSAEISGDGVDLHPPEMQPFEGDESGPLPTISLVGFSAPHRGTVLLKSTISRYIQSWLGLQIVDDGDIVLLNEETAPVMAATQAMDIRRPFVVLSSARGNAMIMAIANDHERIGGFSRILYKPSGPSRLRAMLKLAIHAVAIAKSRLQLPSAVSTHYHESIENKVHSNSYILRRNFEESIPIRPNQSQRSSSAPLPMFLLSPGELVDRVNLDGAGPTIAVGNGGTLLKSSVGSLNVERRFRILVVEDNNILRTLLMKWLSNKGYDLRAAVDGRQGVTVFEKEGPFDVVLLDLSMPILDGFGATSEIRSIEARMTREASTETPRSRILALTGMSSLEDKRRAFEAGVDGYLVKPVAFKTLDEMFHKLRVS